MVSLHPEINFKVLLHYPSEMTGITEQLFLCHSGTAGKKLIDKLFLLIAEPTQSYT